MPSSGRAASSATGTLGVRQWGKMFVIRRFCIKTEIEMKQSTIKRERTGMKGKKREESVCVSVCVCVCVRVCVHR